MQIRLIEGKDRLQLGKLHTTAFFGSADPERSYNDMLERERVNPPAFDPDKPENYGCFDDDGNLHAAMVVIPYKVMFDGKVTRMAGIAGVATFPEYRRGGHVRRLFEYILDKEYNGGTEFSYLYPFSYSYYRMFGYELNYKKSINKVEANLFGKLPQTGGRIRQFDIQKDGDTIVNIYNDFVADKNLAVLRNKGYWERVLKINPYFSMCYTYIYQDDSGKDAGYLIFKREGNDYVVSELCYLSSAALMRLLGFLYSFNSITDKITVITQYGLDLQKIISEQFDIAVEVKPGGMNRIVRLDKVLGMVKLNGGVVLKVSDPYITANNGTWQVIPNGGGNDVKNSDLSPDLEMSITSLAQLATGFADVRELEVYGTVTVNNPAARDVFTKKDIYLNDVF